MDMWLAASPSILKELESKCFIIITAFLRISFSKPLSPPQCHSVLFNILTYSAGLPTTSSPIPSVSLAHCQLMTMTMRESNLSPAQSGVRITQGGTVSALSGCQPLLAPPQYLCLPISSTAWLEVHTATGVSLLPTLCICQHSWIDFCICSLCFWFGDAQKVTECTHSLGGM